MNTPRRTSAGRRGATSKLVPSWRGGIVAGIVAGLVSAVAGGVRPAAAAGTSPVLALTGASAARTSGGACVVTASGSYHFDDLVQVAFPAAGLIVMSGDRFVRYDVGGQVIEATSAAVRNGLMPAELPALLALTGTPVGPARIARLGAGEVAVELPSDLTAGSALVVLYALHEGESFVSNAIPVVLP